VRRQAPSAHALRCYVRSRHPLDRLVISYDRSILPGYAWIFPLPGGEFNVGCGVPYHEGRSLNLRRIFERFVREFPPAVELMREAEGVSPLRGAMLRCDLEGVRPRAAGRVLFAGETIGSTFSLTGEGIGKAMETGELAAELTHESLRTGRLEPLAAFETRLRRDVAPRFRAYRIAERWLSTPRLVDLFAQRIRASSFLRAGVAGIVDESVDPRTVFSLGGLARSFFS
jgi:flavin-dependent dehydrogenase